MSPFRLLVLLLAAGAAGCYTYSPVDIRELSTGDGIRARVSGARADSLETILPGDARLLEGTVTGIDGEAVVIEVPVNTDVRGIRVRTLNQRVDVPIADVVEAEIRQLNRGRTYGAIGVAALVVGYFVYDQLTDRTGLDDDPEVPPPNESIPFGLRLLTGRR